MPEVGRRLSVVLPVLNEAARIEHCLKGLQDWRRAGHEVIVVDGGSRDESRALAIPWADRVLDSEAGRARQMNAGASQASGEWLLFLHADTQLPDGALEVLCEHLPQAPAWGFCQVRLSGVNWRFRIIERAMFWRARLTAVATGDMGLLVHRTLFERVGGFPDIALMEDVALCKHLRTLTSPKVMPLELVADSRRWEREGIIRTVWLMWRLRLAYFLGVSPERLVDIYYPSARTTASGKQGGAE